MSNIKSVKEIGSFQTYDLEVDHPDHQFYLANGMLTSNSHSILYSMTGYKTAYLKAHFPIEFLLANLMAEVKSATPDAKANIDKIKKEIRQHKVKIVPPELNKAQLTYIVEGDKLITGLDAIKFVGDDAILDILAKRPFTSFFDFMHRISSKAVRANSIQALAASGALDIFATKTITRKAMFLYCSDYRKKLQSWLKKHDPAKEKFEYPWPTDIEWTKPELYALEHHYLGEGFICKPSKAYGAFFEDDHTLVQQIKKAKEKTTFKSMKGIVKDFFEFRIKKEGSKNYGKTMVKATIEDKTGDQCSVTIFPEQWEKLQQNMKAINKKAKFEAGLGIHFSGTTNNYEDNMGIILYDLFNLAMPPSMPNDLKSKKISMKALKNKSEPVEEIKFNEPKDIQDHLEDILYNEGLIELDDENDE
jgi:DNA polymerase III alpha subunit